MLDDFRSAPIPDAERALFAYIEKLVRTPNAMEEADAAALRAAGWSDEAIYDAVMVCGLFSFYNRWIDATGVHEMSAEDHRQSGKRMARRGYLMSGE